MVEWAAVVRMSWRHRPVVSVELPQLTMRRAAPLDSSKPSVPAWASGATMGGGGRPQSTMMVVAARAEALEAGMGRARRRLALGLGLGEHQIDQRRRLLEAAVEQRQAAVAVAEEAQHRRRAVDRVLEIFRDVDMAGDQHAADVDQMPEQDQLMRRVAVAAAAVGQDQPAELGLEQRQPARHALFRARQADAGVEQRLGRGQTLQALGRALGAALELGDLAHQAVGEGRAEAVLGAVVEERVLADPVDQALGQDVDLLRLDVVAAVMLDPVAHEIARRLARVLGGEAPQIAQPVEGLGIDRPMLRHDAVERIGAADDGLGARGVGRPRVRRHGVQVDRAFER